MKRIQVLMTGLLVGGAALAQLPEPPEPESEIAALYLQRADAAMRAEDQARRARSEGEPRPILHPLAALADLERLQYDDATRALDREKWDEAFKKFAMLADKKSSLADGALYWEAYAANRLGKQQEALAAIEKLATIYASSRWLDDAKALQMEIRQRAGRPVNPEEQSNEDLKLIALNGLIGSNPEQALPSLEKLLRGSASPRVKNRALFVLTQSNTPRARQLLSEVARGKANPDLQLKAVRYLGMTGTPDARKELDDIYRQATDIRIKRSILSGYMLANAREPLLEVAKSEKDPKLRRDAIQQLALLRGHQELWQLYHLEASPELKAQILSSLTLSEDFDALLKIATTESDARLRAAAIQSLSFVRSKSAEGVFANLYAKEADPKIKLQILNAMFIHRDAKSLIAIARTEPNQSLKRAAVTKLSQMHSKEATDFLRELLEK